MVESTVRMEVGEECFDGYDVCNSDAEVILVKSTVRQEVPQVDRILKEMTDVDVDEDAEVLLESTVRQEVPQVHRVCTDDGCRCRCPTSFCAVSCEIMVGGKCLMEMTSFHADAEVLLVKSTLRQEVR